MAEDVTYPDLVVVGAGLFGLTVAQQAVENLMDNWLMHFYMH